MDFPRFLVHHPSELDASRQSPSHLHHHRRRRRSSSKPQLHRSHTALPNITTTRTGDMAAAEEKKKEEAQQSAGAEGARSHSRVPHLHRSSHSHRHHRHHHPLHNDSSKQQRDDPTKQGSGGSRSAGSKPSGHMGHLSHSVSSHRHLGASARDAIHSAIQLQPPSAFGELLRSGTKSAGNSTPGSRQQSRRQSVAGIGSVVDGAGNSGSGSGSGGSLEFQRRWEQIKVTKEDVEREKAKAKLRQEDIRATLASLLHTSLRSTSRLDDTYYSILSHVSALRATITNLQDLTNLTKSLHTTFQSDTFALQRSIASQTSAFESSFDTQTQRIQTLQDRIRKSKEKASRLDDRLDEANRQVQQWEEREQEESERSKRRMRIMWSVIGILASIFVPLALIGAFRGDDDVNVKPPWAFATPSSLLSPLQSVMTSAPDAAALDARLEEVHAPEEVKKILSSVRAAPFARERASSLEKEEERRKQKKQKKTTTSEEGESTLESEPISEDPLLRIFDEL